MNQNLKIKSIRETKKITDVSGLIKKTDFNAKVTEIEGKIPSIIGLATNSALTAVENKIPDVSSLVKRQTTTQKYQIVKRKVLITVITNLLLLQNLILWQQMFLIQD